MKKFPVKYQVLNITEKISASVVNEKFAIELLPDWKYLIGIAFISRGGAGVDNYITISDNNITIFDKAPIKIFTKSFRDINKPDSFMPVNIPASGNIIEILFQAATVTTAYDIDVVFMLANEHFEISKYNFQTKKITVPNLTATKWESPTIRLNSAYAEVIGFLINKSLAVDVRAGVKDASGNYLLDLLDSRLLELNTTDTINYDNTFFPVRFKSDQVIRIEIEPIIALVADLNIDVVFLLQNKIKK